jgi:hypothetical protein
MHGSVGLGTEQRALHAANMGLNFNSLLELPYISSDYQLGT